MALSGSFYKNVGSGWRLQMEWSATQSVTNNTSSVTAKLYWMSLGSSYTVNSTATKSAGIQYNDITPFDYNTEAGLAALSGNQKKLIHSKTFTISHNADGTGSFSLDGNFKAEVTLSGTFYGTIDLDQKSYTLDTIPRKSSLTTSASWTAGSNFTLTISRASTSFRHEAEVYVGNKATDVWNWIKQVPFTTSQTSLSSSFTVTENTEIFTELNQAGSKDTRVILQTFSGDTHIGSNYYYGTCTNPSASTVIVGSSTGQTDIYRYVDEGAIIYLQEANSALTHDLTFTLGSYSFSRAGIGSSTTVTLSQTEKNGLYGQMTTVNSKEGTLSVTTYYNGVQTRATVSRSFFWYVRNSNPTFSASYVTYGDINATTKGVTGNDQYIIQNKSSLAVWINTSATAINGASLSSYVVTIGGIERTLTFANGTGGHEIGVINATSNMTLYIKAVDSRGNSTTVSKNINVVPYSAPSLTYSAKRNDGFSEPTTVKANGSISAISIGGVQKNSVTYLQYRYLPSGGSWTSWTNFIYTTSTTSFTASNVTLSLDTLKSYTVEFKVVDKLSTTTKSVTVSTGQPLLFIDATKKSVGINKLPVSSNYLEVVGHAEISGQVVVGKGFNTMLIPSGNCNSALETGFYMYDNPSNRPTYYTGQHSWVYLIVINHNDNYVYQEVTDFNNTGKHTRVKMNGTFTGWKRVY